MPYSIFVNSIEEISNGLPLKLEDYSGVNTANVWLEMPKTDYEMHSKSFPKWIGGTLWSNYKERCYTESVHALSLHNRVPFFKKHTTFDLTIKWNHASLYLERIAGSESYQEAIYFFQQAADLFKLLVEEILPLFEESARETVKCLILNETLVMAYRGICVRTSLIVKQIIEHTSGKYKDETTPPELIAVWEHLLSNASILAVEADKYRDVESRHRYNEHKLQYSQIPKEERLEPRYVYLRDESLNPDSRKYNRFSIYLDNEYLKPVKKALAEFHKIKPSGIPLTIAQREALQFVTNNNQVATAQHPEGIFVEKHSRVLMWSMQTAYSAQTFLSNLVSPLVYNQAENDPLLGTTVNYKPIYKSPKRVPAADSIDQNIIANEKKLIAAIAHIATKNTAELFEILNICLQNVNLIRMRYSLSLNTQAAEYFELFEWYANHNRKVYCQTLEYYVTNFIAAFIQQVIALNQSNPIDQIIKDLDSIINACKGYTYVFKHYGDTTIDLLDNLTAEVAACDKDSYLTQGNSNEQTGLRKRLTAS